MSPSNSCLAIMECHIIYTIIIVVCIPQWTMLYSIYIRETSEYQVKCSYIGVGGLTYLSVPLELES